MKFVLSDKFITLWASEREIGFNPLIEAQRLATGREAFRRGVDKIVNIRPKRLIVAVPAGNVIGRAFAPDAR